MQQDATSNTQSMITKRWTRYGKDRVYVSTESGQRVGWHDLLTGASTVEMPEFEVSFRQAVERHLRDLGIGPHARADDRCQRVPESFSKLGPEGSLAPTMTRMPSPRRQVPAWSDLALNRPGQGVRAEAEARLVEMKANSRFKTFLARAFDVKTDERAFRVGADGEESVGARLDQLKGNGWHVLHSIPVGQRGSDIDHLVITSGGVYPVNTKRHPRGKVWVGETAILVNGQRTDYLRNSRYEAQRVRRALGAHLSFDIPVKPVLVFLTGTVAPQVTIKQMPADVVVLNGLDVPRAFTRPPQRLTWQMIEEVYAVARRSTTW